ncbi:MAG: carboxylesterase/lipase family protein, partial [Bacteroidota bacterium]
MKTHARFPMNVITMIILVAPIVLVAQSPVVKTSNGPVEGYKANGLEIFKGIPFAAPPVGELRWKAPMPPVPWKEVRQCTAFGPSPIQSPPVPFMFWSKEFLIPSEPISEDCLYLNVWTQERKTKKPVLIYIYGGGFRSGGSACPIYDGEAMAKKGIVFVSINYRVGLFGFLAHPELSAESASGSSGNYALLDMIAGLKWVKDNIASFGGDPSRVTIAGQSAGAFAVNFLCASPLAKGLFSGAIAQSGGSILPSPIRPKISKQRAEQMGLELEQELGVNGIRSLRSLPAEKILAAKSGLMGPYDDGHVIRDGIATTYDNGRQNDVPLLLGWNGDDRVSGPPLKAAAFRETMTKRFGANADQLLALYPAGTDEQGATSQLDMSRDETFAIQGWSWALIQQKKGKQPVYLYNFNRALPAYTPETAFGAFHSAEIVYAYDNLHTLDRPWEAADRTLATDMSTYWLNFIKSGNPNESGKPEWPAFKTSDLRVMVLDTKTQALPLPGRSRLEWWA